MLDKEVFGHLVHYAKGTCLTFFYDFPAKVTIFGYVRWWAFGSGCPGVDVGSNDRILISFSSDLVFCTFAAVAAHSAPGVDDIGGQAALCEALLGQSILVSNWYILS